MNNFFLIFILLSMESSLSIASPQDCYELQGNYTAFPTGVITSPATLAISYNAIKNEMQLQFGVIGNSRYRIERYLADEKSHTGDGNWSSNFYIAKCTASSFSIKKDYSPQYPRMNFTSVFGLKNGVLTQLDFNHDTNYSIVRGEYIRQ